MAENTYGWLKVYRTMLDNWLWKGKPFSKGQAWIDMLLIAEPKETKIPYKGEVINCPKGTINRSILSLSERWGWSREKTKVFLKTLQSDGMIHIEATTHRTTVTLVNYDNFQGQHTTNHTTNRQQTLQQADNRPTTDIEYKNNRSVRSSSSELPPPTQNDIFSFAAENNLGNVDCIQFFTYYDCSGWKTKKGEPITDWQSLLIRWNKTEKVKPKESQEGIAAYDLDLFEKMVNEKD